MPPPIRVLALMESSSVGGPAKNLIDLGVRGAQTGDLHLAVATFQRGSVPPNGFILAGQEAGLDVHVLSERRRFDMSPRQQMRDLIGHLQPDILQSHNIKSHLLIRSLSLQQHYPWVVFQHGYTTTDLKDRLYNQVDRWTITAADRVVAVCQAFAHNLVRRGVALDRIRIQHNSVRPFVAPPAETLAIVREQWKLDGQAVLLTVGRLSAEKGHADLLRALSILTRRGNPPGRLLIVGDGPERLALQQLAIGIGIEHLVVFAGHQSNVQPYYGLADLLVLPSHSEGSPNVVLEALAAGLPILATAVGGVPEILTHEQTGLLVPPRDPPAMAAALERLSAEPALRSQLAAAALRHSRVFTPEARYQSILGVYREVLDFRTSP